MNKPKREINAAFLPKVKGPKTVPSQAQLPGGIVLKGLPFKILTFNEDGSPKTFELLASDVKQENDIYACTLFAHEEWIRSPVRKIAPAIQHPTDPPHCMTCGEYNCQVHR